MARPTQYQKLSLQLDAENKKLKAKLAQTKKSFGGLGTAAKKMGALVGGAFAAHSVISFGKQIISLTSEYGSMISRVQALTGASKELTTILSKQAQMLGKTTQFTATEAAEAMTFLAQAGLSVKDIYDAMPGTLQLAAAGQVSLAEAADIATNVMSAYGLQAKDLGRVNDIIANTTTNANTNVIEFAEAFKMVGPIAKAAGQRIEDVSAMIGLLANAGIKGTMAGTAMRTMMAKLIQPTGEAATLLKQFGVTTTDVDGQLRPLTEIMKEMDDAGMDVADMFTVFDLRAAGAASVLKDASLTLKDFIVDVEKTGTAAEIAAKQMDNLKGDTLRLDSAWKGLMLTIGESGDNDFRWLTQALTNDLQRFSDMVEGVTPRFRRWREGVKEMNLSSGELSAQIGLLNKKIQESQTAFDKMTVTRNDKQFKDAAKNLEAYKKQLGFLNELLAVSTAGAAKDGGLNAEELPLTDDDQNEVETKSKDLGVKMGVAIGEGLKGVFNGPEGVMPAVVQQLDMVKTSTDAAFEAFQNQQGIVLEGWTSMAQVVGIVANGIANAKDNWAAMAATMLSGFVQLTPLIQEQIANIKKLMVAKKSEAVGSAIASGAAVPFPGNLIAIATGVATVLTSIAPFIGSFATGIDYVPKTGLAMLHKGEKVTPAASNVGGGQLVAVVKGADLQFVLDEYSQRRGASY